MYVYNNMKLPVGQKTGRSRTTKQTKLWWTTREEWNKSVAAATYTSQGLGVTCFDQEFRKRQCRNRMVMMMMMMMMMMMVSVSNNFSSCLPCILVLPGCDTWSVKGWGKKSTSTHSAKTKDYEIWNPRFFHDPLQKSGLIKGFLRETDG